MTTMWHEWSTLEKLIWLRRRIGGGASWVWRTITGAAPLTLPNAVHHAIKSLTQYGLCTQDGTPTPDSPVDIVCNNGALRYGALGANLFDTNPACIKLNFYIQPSDGAEQLSTTNFTYIPHIPVEAGKSYVFFGRKKSDHTISQYNRISFFAADGTYLSTASYPKGSIGKGTAPENASYCILSCNPSGESAAVGAPITQEIVDSYDWTFREGTAEQAFEPFEGGIYADGTPEVLTVNGANLFDASSYTEINAYVNANTGVLTAGSPGSNTQYCAVIPCKPNTLYNITGRGTSAWGAFPSDSIGTTATAFTKGGILTTGANDRYLIGLVRANGDAIDYRNTLVVQEAQTVNDVPMLLSVGDYADTVEIISGLFTYKVGVLVLDGTEDWRASGNLFYADIATDALEDTHSCYCTHFKGVATNASANYDNEIKVGTNVTQTAKWTRAQMYPVVGTFSDVTEFKAYIAAQYAAGTPVIVVYPLAESTTEQGTPHALHTSAGDNVVDVTANVSPVELEVEYASNN